MLYRHYYNADLPSISLPYMNSTLAQDNKTKIGDQSQISSIWLAEITTSRHFSQSDAGYWRLVSRLSFLIFGNYQTSFLAKNVKDADALKAWGSDQIRLLKASGELPMSLSKFYNTLLFRSYFPHYHYMKQENISTIYKKAYSQDPSTHRPITLLSSLG
jgi:hypothetical protein